MLSILIPVYNFDVQQLVLDLLEQGRKLDIPFEILVYDDASPGLEKQHNRSIANHPEVVYQELEHNRGRSAIRNELAQSAKYEYLLFLDGDSEIVSSTFLQDYISNAQSEIVQHGGTAYQDRPPDDQQKYLRWYYGISREVRTPEQRKVTGFHGFTSNNFFIPKAVFQAIQFDESIEGYGHEDTLFGFALSDQNINIKYLDNPLGHIGLESAEIFLKKTREGVSNLKRLHQEGKPVKTRLLSAYLLIEKWKLKWVISSAGNLIFPHLEKNLLGKNPRLWVLDLYKLIWMFRK